MYKEHKLNKNEKKLIKKYLSGKEDLPIGGFRELFTFDDGYAMALSIEDVGKCRAVLRNKEGEEVSEVIDDNYDGIWYHETDDDVYILEIKR